MKKFPALFIWTFIAVLMLNPVAQSQARADEVARKIITGWMPYYSTAEALASIESNTAYIKEVMPFWFTLKFDSKTKSPRIVDLYSTLSENKLEGDSATVVNKLSKKYKVIPTITDGTGTGILAGLLSNAASRKQIVDLISQATVVNRYDGIDLDFEGFAFSDPNTTWSKTAPSWVVFIKELSKALHAQGKLLSISTPYVLDPAGPQKGYYVYSWAAIASSIDKLRIMTYDYSVAKAGPLGPITWTERTVKYAASIMDPSKVFIGLPAYARGWITNVTGVCPKQFASSIKTSAKLQSIPVSQIPQLRESYGFVPQYNPSYAETTFSYQKVYNGTLDSGLTTSCTATNTYWYQDEASLGVRAELVPKYKLGGVAVWALGMEVIKKPTGLEVTNILEGIRSVATKYAVDSVKTSLFADQEVINYAEPITLNGLVTYKNELPLINFKVSIERYSQTLGKWISIASTYTDAQGKFNKQLLLGSSSQLRVSTAETTLLADSSSPSVFISVNRLITVAPPASMKMSESFTVTGSIRPRTAGTFINVEKLVAGKWQPFGGVLTTDAQGAFVIPISGQTKGTLTLRVSAAGEANWAIATTRAFTILIRSAAPSGLVK